MGAFPKPCLNCGKLTDGSIRCLEHKRIHDLKRQKRKKRDHYKGDYGKRAKYVRDNAEICWICGGGYAPNDPWTADHYYPAQPDSPLLPAHRSCNSRRGNQPDTPRIK